MSVRIINDDAVEGLRSLPDASHQCCVTSPPYYGLRDYGYAGQIGLEPSPEEYITRMVEVFREVRRVLRDDGTLWLNIGDSYAMTTKGSGGSGKQQQQSNAGSVMADRSWQIPVGYKPKDLLGIPWQLAFALRADGWFLRADIIWHKPNPMPESVRDRPTSAYEHVFLLTKQARYFYDAEAISEEFATAPYKGRANGAIANGDRADKGRTIGMTTTRRNARNVWTITPKPYRGAHFAVMPIDLAERCIKAGSARGDAVLDPFGGAGTTGLAAQRLGRIATLIELNNAYCDLAATRLNVTNGIDFETALADLRAAVQRNMEARHGFR